jgi:hypothetical protein
MKEKQIPTPEEILQLKDELKERWRQLPVEHQSVVVLNLLREVLDGEYGLWTTLAVKILYPEFHHEQK